MTSPFLVTAWRRAKKSDRLLALFASLFVAAILAFLLYNVPVAGALLKGVFVALFGATGVEIFFFLRSMYKFSIFKYFFGDYFGDKTIYLVYPEFDLIDDILCYCGSHNIPKSKMYKNIHSDPDVPCNIFVPKTVANNDMEALLLVHSFLVRQGVSPALMPVSALDAVSCSVECLVSFGFTSNIYSISAIKGCEFVKIVSSDNGEYFEYIEVDVVHSENLLDRYQFCSTDKFQIGIICRHSLRPSDKPDERWFMCGGIGPWGTIASARYLTESWSLINEKVGDADFVAIIEITTKPLRVIAPSLLMLATKHSRHTEFNPEALRKYLVKE